MEKTEKIKVDLIQLFPTHFLKHKKKIDREMKKIAVSFCERENVTGVIWGYGNHYLKSLKRLPTFYICFSNDESLKRQLMFYGNEVQQKLNKEVVEMFERLKIKLPRIKK